MLAQLKTLLAEKINQATGLSHLDIYKSLEVPKNESFGHLAWPVFSYAKAQGKNPNEVAQQLKTDLSSFLPQIQSIEVVGGFLNFKFLPQVLNESLFKALSNSTQLSKNDLGQAKTVVIDFSSPNVAKKMHVGHLRATIIGQALSNLHKACGYEVVGLNHLGDWGTQFGKLAWSVKRWGSELGDKLWTIEGLLELYVRFHDEAEKHPHMEVEASETFLRLERGDQEIKKLWTKIVEVSLEDYSRLYKILNVTHEKTIGESFYNDRLLSVIQLLESKNLLVESEGARVVKFPENENLSPCLIQKSDGASLYATRDLASALFRKNDLKGDLLVYVVGADQALHFKQVFRVLEMCDFAWAKNCHHVSFGLYRFKEGKMSTRKGRVIHLEDVLSTAIELVEGVFKEKGRNIEDSRTTIQDVAIGAVIFNDLMNDRVKNVEFDWDRAISTEGDSGPYVQYTAVRCKSLLRKKPGYQFDPHFSAKDWNESELSLIFRLSQFAETVKASCQQFKPNLLAQYLLQVCSQFSHFYHENRVLDEPLAIEMRRLHLVYLTEKVLSEGLGLLGIKCPEQM
ncbi:MAG: arginine--tRNA ligase [Bdellovibrionales bacterium]